jgi:hypothetical protein
MEREEFHLAQSRHKFLKTAHRAFVSGLQYYFPINGKIVLHPPKSHSDEPAQTPARETPRRDTNRDRRKDK